MHQNKFICEFFDFNEEENKACLRIIPNLIPKIFDFQKSIYKKCYIP